jgi:hypothetical protein
MVSSGQIFRETHSGRRHFDPRLDRTRLARDVAIQWAAEIRKLVEANPNAEIVA